MHQDEDPDLILPEQWQNTPIRALRATPNRKIAQHLDLDGYVIVGNDGTYDIDISNDYNGLAELAGFTALEIRNLARMRSPTEELLLHWGMGTQDRATVGLLWKYLLMMDRVDVIKDCRRAILHDCVCYEAEKRREEDRDNILQDPAVSNSDMDTDETRYATYDDVLTGKRTKYVAFVCYTVTDPADREFVRNLIEQIEVKHGLKLFVPGRDDLPGSAEHSITAYLIECRCERVVIVMSESFMQSAACEFQMKFAHALAPGARSKRLIPIIRHKNMRLPRILKILAPCDFTKLDMNDWAWDRLAISLKAPLGPSTYDDMDYETDGQMDLRDIRYPTQNSESASPTFMATPGLSDSFRSVDSANGFSSSNDENQHNAFSYSSSDSTGCGYNSLDNTDSNTSQDARVCVSTNRGPVAPRTTQSEVYRRFKPASGQQFNSAIVVRTSSMNSDETSSGSETPQVAGGSGPVSAHVDQSPQSHTLRKQPHEAQASGDDEKTVLFRDQKCRYS